VGRGGPAVAEVEARAVWSGAGVRARRLHATQHVGSEVAREETK